METLTIYVEDDVGKFIEVESVHTAGSECPYVLIRLDERWYEEWRKVAEQLKK